MHLFNVPETVDQSGNHDGTVTGNESGSSSGLSKSAIVGLVVTFSFVVIIIVLAFYCFGKEKHVQLIHMEDDEKVELTLRAGS